VPLIETIEHDFQAAFKAKDQTVISTLRLLKSEIVKKEKEGKPLTEEIVIQVLKSQVKQRKDSIAEYEKGGRGDLVNKEKSELAILEKYLPTELTPEQIGILIDEVLSVLTDAEKSNFGKVMGLVIRKAGGAADGAVVNRLVKEKLGQA
jgi:uncharacterized protein YqeY